MKPLSAKKEARLQKKKRKLEALVHISKLNDMDKVSLQTNSNASSKSDREAGDSEQSTGSEPNVKRSKSNDSSSADSTDVHKKRDASVVLSDEDYAQLKRELNKKKSDLKNVPKFRLKLFGDSASLTISPSIRTPIFLTDIQHLIMYALFGGSSPCVPTRWCHLEKVNKVSHTVVVVLDGLSLYHYSSYETLFESCTKIFESKLEVVMPDGKSGDQMLSEIITVPLTDIFRKELIEKYGSLEAAVDSTKNPVLMVNTIFPVSDNENSICEANGNSADAINDDVEIFPRTQLLLSALQMVDEGYPLPLRGELANRYKDFVLTKDCYKAVSANSPMFGVDCEMCRTSAGVNELTRISIINENHESIYETLVCPQNKIVDYLTQYSGITPQMMESVTKTLAQVQDDVRRILPADAILVGQSLQSDLMAMRMMHPYVIDTSLIFNLSGDRRRKSKLQTLASEFLGEAIQKNPLGHDSIEDCSASLKLTKLKLLKGIDFGDAILMNRRRLNEKHNLTFDGDKKKIYEQAATTITTAIAAATTTTTTTSNKMDRSAAVVTSSETNSEAYQALIKSKLEQRTDANSKTTTSTTATTTTSAANNDSDLSSSSEPSTKNIRLYKNSSNNCAVQKTCEIALNHALTLSHLNIPEKYLNEAKIEKSFRKIDQWIETIWQSIAPNGFFIVLFGGNSPENSASGVALLQTKSAS